MTAFHPLNFSAKEADRLAIDLLQDSDLPVYTIHNAELTEAELAYARYKRSENPPVSDPTR